jgi:hypothetical protein
VVEPLDLALLERHELGTAARILDGFPRLGELDLLDHVGREERDLLSVELGHVGPPFQIVSGGSYPGWTT